MVVLCAWGTMQARRRRGTMQAAAGDDAGGDAAEGPQGRGGAAEAAMERPGRAWPMQGRGRRRSSGSRGVAGGAAPSPGRSRTVDGEERVAGESAVVAGESRVTQASDVLRWNRHGLPVVTASKQPLAPVVLYNRY